jgi:membrane associated rhomboid family serine protease
LTGLSPTPCRSDAARRLEARGVNAPDRVRPARIIVGYPVFAFAGYWAIALFSGNTFDRSVEASMTSIFVIGPIGAVVGLVAGLMLAAALSRKPAPQSDRSGRTHGG